jgi:hypothetical protein
MLMVLLSSAVRLVFESKVKISMPVAMEIQGAPTMDWTRFQTSECFLTLSQKQRMWLSIYVDTGDAWFATQLAYQCKTPEIAKRLSFKVKRSPKIRRALAEFRGDTRDPRADLIEKVERNLVAAEPGSVAAQRLLFQLERLKLTVEPVAPDPKPEPKRLGRPRKTIFKIGDICVQRGQKFRVTAVDDAGQPTEAVEVE